MVFNEATPGTGLQGIARAVGDQRYTESTGDNIRVKHVAPYLGGLWYCAETTPAEARIRQESRLQDLQFLLGVDLNDPSLQGGFSNFLQMPILVRAGEYLTCLQVNGTDEDTLIGMLLTPNAWPENRYVAPTHIIHGVDDLTQTALTWSMLPSITWDQDLPDGLYTIIGAKVGSYTAGTYMQCFFRIISDRFLWRPGGPCIQAEADKTVVAGAFSNQPYFNWGYQEALTFHSKSMPSFEVCGPGTNTDWVIELQLVAQDPNDIGNLTPNPL